jgi:hypothetical protein
MTKQIPAETFELDGFQASAVIRVMMDRVRKVEEQAAEATSEEAANDLEFLRETYLSVVHDMEERLWKSGRIQDKSDLRVYYPPEIIDAPDVED